MVLRNLFSYKLVSLTLSSMSTVKEYEIKKGLAEKLFKYLHENQAPVLTSKYKNQTSSAVLGSA